MKELILGGVKSGKSKLAEQRANASGLAVTYIATAMKSFNGIVDEALHTRIKKHQQQRPEQWKLIEEPLQLATTISNHSTRDNCLLIDCLTLWMTNLLLDKNPSLLTHETDALINTLENTQGQIIFVSNETNLGIIPDSELSRRFCDETGILHQRLAAACDNVILTVAGLPHVLKGNL